MISEPKNDPTYVLKKPVPSSSIERAFELRERGFKFKDIAKMMRDEGFENGADKPVTTSNASYYYRKKVKKSKRGKYKKRIKNVVPISTQAVKSNISDWTIPVCQVIFDFDGMPPMTKTILVKKILEISEENNAVV